MDNPPELDDAAASARERSLRLTKKADALRAQGRWLEALPLCFEALRVDPTHAGAAHNLGVMLTKMGRLAEGEEANRSAVALAPGSPLMVHGLAHNLLAQGRYREAWPLYEVRSQVPGLNTGFPTNFAYPRWHGEPLDGKRLAIFPEQGLGDQIQFARFLPQLIEQAGAVTLLTLPALERLFRHNFPKAEVVVAAGKAEFPDPNYWTTLHDLPGVLGVEVGSIPNQPYLKAAGTWPDLGKGFKIGLKTKGNPKHINDAARSLPPDCAERLRTELPGQVISLEPEESGAKDMADTAAMIAQLDLIVSVDTSVAHLAGAMGKPCLLLISGFSPDWRWMFGRNDSPWYPKHRLYRGELSGDWRPAIERLIADAARQAARSAAQELIEQAKTLRAQGKPLAALEMAADAMAADPGNIGVVYNYGMLLSDCGRLVEGEALLRRAVAVAPGVPEPRNVLGTNLLAQGRYREGWPFWEAGAGERSRNEGLPRSFPFPRWKGEDLKGKRIALFPDQSFSDQLQFVRFIPTLVQRGAQVTLLTTPPLVRLFQMSFPDVQVLAASGSVDFPDPDFWAMLRDLPARLGAMLHKLPANPYLRVPSYSRNSSDFRVGLITKGSPACPHDRYRSLPPDLAQHLARVLPGTVVDLSSEETGARDFAETANLIADLDLVVSVDTAVAHLAGAMGKPCLLLVHGFATDWRWMRDRGDSPWYPFHRLYRSSVDGNWQAAVERLVADAEAWIARPLLPVDRGENNLAFPMMRQAAELRDSGRYMEAIDVMRRVIRMAPDNGPAHNILGMLLHDVGQLDEAERLLRRALALAPDYPGFSNSLSLILLAQGRYREAWPYHEMRAEVPSLTIGFPTGVPCPRWRGEPLAGKRLTIMPEQGFGDQIQMARFVPQLQQLGASITLFAPPALVDLFRLSLPGVEIRSATGEVRLGDPDYWTTLIDIARPLGVTLESLPRPPYLRTDRTWPKLPDGFNIGLQVNGNPNHPNNARRSLPAEAAERLRANLPGQLLSLDPRDSGARDFADSAALIERLDLVVSVDTAVAHLAGALGKPCLLLVPGLATDWRWMRGREDSPWYPNHRLYRGALDGSWSAVIDRLCVDAHGLVSNPS